MPCQQEGTEQHQVQQTGQQQTLQQEKQQFKFSYKQTFIKQSLEQYGVFIKDIIQLCFNSIYETSSYSQITTSLNTLSLLASIFHDNPTSCLYQYIHIPDEVKIDYCKVLFNSFSDPYEPNKVLVYSIIKLLPIFLPKECPYNFEVVLSDALQLMVSPQPDVSSIAAYHFLYIALLLPNNYIDSSYTHYIDKCVNGSCEPYFTFEPDRLHSFAPLFVMDILLDQVKLQLKVMKVSLLKASKGAPMYGTLYTIRLLLQNNRQVFLDAMQQSNLQEGFKRMVSDLISLCLEVITLVSPFVSSDAPEGELCDASIADVFDQLSMEDKCSVSDVELQAQIARILLVCSWRSMKEVSLLLGLLVSEYICFSKDKSLLLIPIETVQNVWEMFCQVLLHSKHAGAYELASLGFMRLCSMLWTSAHPKLRCIPVDAVTLMIHDLTSDGLQDLPVTRRSAGIPFYMQALCSTEPPINANSSFKKLMSALVKICLEEYSHDTLNQRIISLNILRAFYKDAKLGEDVLPYISDGIVIAITGFGSNVWAVRNCSTLLFSALMQRVFGVKKLKMTGREFFSRFPSLYNFLIEQAEVMNEFSSGLKLHPSVFPVLLLLSHLYPSAIDGTDTMLSLDRFIPHVIR